MPQQAWLFTVCVQGIITQTIFNISYFTAIGELSMVSSVVSLYTSPITATIMIYLFSRKSWRCARDLSCAWLFYALHLLRLSEVLTLAGFSWGCWPASVTVLSRLRAGSPRVGCPYDHDILYDGVWNYRFRCICCIYRYRIKYIWMHKSPRNTGEMASLIVSQIGQGLPIHGHISTFFENMWTNSTYNITIERTVY